MLISGVAISFAARGTMHPGGLLVEWLLREGRRQHLGVTAPRTAAFWLLRHAIVGRERLRGYCAPWMELMHHLLARGFGKTFGAHTARCVHTHTT